MGVDDACSRALERARSPDTLSIPRDLITTHPPRGHAEFVLAQGVDLVEGLSLDLVLRDDPLTGATMADVVLFT